MEEYLKAHHEADILTILKTQSVKEFPFKSLKIDLKVLKVENVELFKKVNYRMNVYNVRPSWVKALNAVQKEILETHSNKSLMSFSTVKSDFPVTFVNHPEADVSFKPFNKLWKLLQIEGSVVRSMSWRKQEIVKDFSCRKCKQGFQLQADRIQKFVFTIPTKCPRADCKGTVYEKETLDGVENLKNFINSQEITVQPYNKPTMLTVELDEELVETCFVGDHVTICGTYEMRSDKGINQNRKLVMRAVSVLVHKHQQKMNYDPLEMNFKVRDEWQEELEEADNNEFVIREEIVKSAAPLLDGLALAKLGLMLVLCSGGETSADYKKTPLKVREIAHILFIGDPGLGKSQLLRAASEISVNSVRTVGYSITTAGLTATSFTDKGETHLEAGALVKANNGVCCIDEINLMSKDHRGCVHEVMESQEITIHKAGFSGRLSAKCNIIASMNQRNINNAIDASNIAMEGSLMSRFDLVFELSDPNSAEFNENIFDIIVKGKLKGFEVSEKPSSWSLERLQCHVLVAKKIQVTMTDQARALLHTYYIFCKNHEEIDQSRRTPRLYNSLERLTLCHAKLMLRNKTELMDAVTAVMLMESSWSFGHLMPQTSVVLSNFPLGPSNEYFAEVLEKLSLEHLLEDEEYKIPTKFKSQFESTKANQTFELNNIDDFFKDSDDVTSGNIEAFDTEEDDYIFSSQAVEDLMSEGAASQPTNPINTQTLSTFKLMNSQSQSDDIFGEKLTFKPTTQFTSTQSTSRFEKRGSTLDSNIREKKMRFEKAATSDPLKDNLNLLSALYAGNSSAFLKPSSSVEEARPNSFSKLKKFQFKEPESTPESSQLNDENNSLTVQDDKPIQTSKTEQVKVLTSAEDFDFFGDFDLDDE